MSEKEDLNASERFASDSRGKRNRVVAMTVACVSAILYGAFLAKKLADLTSPAPIVETAVSIDPIDTSEAFVDAPSFASPVNNTIEPPFDFSVVEQAIKRRVPREDQPGAQGAAESSRQHAEVHDESKAPEDVEAGPFEEPAAFVTPLQSSGATVSDRLHI